MLQDAYSTAFLADDKDNPADPLGQRILDPDTYFARREPMPAGIACIHGHFHPGKYQIGDRTVLFTLLRHPVDTILSIYFFWKSASSQYDALHAYCAHNNLSILQTARLPILRWLQSRTYFEGFDMGRFDIIGRHDDRTNALRKLQERIGAPLKTDARANLTPHSEERQEALGNARLRRELEDVLADDMRFFERYALRG
jgi:hypothetical protein